MTTLRRLSIKGIRNFSDEDNEINFKCPITLILGENGTGKTTIIESLKYATTGDFPPNSDKGKSFVTDPALGATSSTRAMVKMEFKNKKEKVMSIFRSLEARRGPSSLTLSSIDNTLSHYNAETGKFVNLSSKCANTNIMVTEAIGVSKAILNYVIFCHQDDSFWPLEGGKELKAKLDEIFGTDKYNKALEAIRDIVKNNQAKLRTLNAEKIKTKAMVDEIDSKKNKLKADKERRDQLNKKMEEIDENIEPISGKLDNISKSIEVYQRQVSDSEKKRMEWEVCSKEVAYLRSNIDEVFTGTDDELQAKIESFQKDFDDKSTQIDLEQNKLDEGYENEKEITKSLNEQKVKLGSLKLKQEEYQSRVEKRNELVINALKNWNIDCPGTDVDEDEARVLMKTLEDKLSSFEDETERERVKKEREEKLMQNEIDSLISVTSSIRSELNVKDQECTKEQSNLQKIRREIANGGTAVNRLKDSELKLEAATEEYDQLLNEVNVDNLKREIEDCNVEERQTEMRARQLDKEIATLNRQSMLQSQINVHQANKKNKMDQIEAIREKHGKSLEKILEVKGEIPMEKLRHSVETAQRKLTAAKNSIQRDVEAAQQQVTSLETTLRHHEKDLKKRMAEIEADKEKVSAYCSYDEYDETLKAQAAKMQSLQDEKGFFMNRRYAYEKYLKEISKEKPCCPLCTRDFTAENEVQQFKRSMKVQMDQNPEEIKLCEAKLKREEARYEAMLQLMPTVNRIVEFENEDSKRIMNTIEETKVRLQKAKDKVDRLNETLSESLQNLHMCAEVITDVALWDQCIDELEKVNRQIKALQHSLQFKTEGSKTLQEVQAERESCDETISSSRKKKERFQSQLEKFNNDKHRAWEKKKGLEEKVLNIRSEMQKLNQLRDKEKELTAKISSLNEQILVLRDSYDDEKNKLTAASETLDKFKVEFRNQQTERKRIINREQQHSYKLTSYQKEIEAYNNLGIVQQLKQCQENIKRLTATLEETKAENEKLAEELQQFRSDYATKERIKKQFLDNVVLRKKQKNVETLEQEYRLQKQNVASLNYNELLSDKSQLERKRSRLIEKRHEIKGIKDELDRGISLLESDLKKDFYINTIKDYQNTCVEIIMTKNTVDDMQLYMQGMDQAMTDYHKDRLNAVNEIIGKMWNQVYQGTDTKTIQIKTESTGKMDSNRRQFNYKLVQTKHDIDMEMKGRCSAGQRVLASIIIRIALAEAFCGDCGVLALDEPTTNLDIQNARSLAQALVKIVESRSKKQKNFQLILITHDEDFLRVLARLDPDNTYFKLQRDERSGRTVISQKKAGFDQEDSYGPGFNR